MHVSLYVYMETYIVICIYAHAHSIDNRYRYIN